MHLVNSHRLCPFSQLPGTLAYLPGTVFSVQIFPTLLRIYSLLTPLPQLLSEIEIKAKGPLQPFLIQSDLEKGRITVSGKSSEGWIRYHLLGSKSGKEVRLLLDRSPLNGLTFVMPNKSVSLTRGQFCDLLPSSQEFEAYIPSIKDRLSFGNYKAQEIDKIGTRLDLSEILPLWHRLGQLVPDLTFPNSVSGGVLQLLNVCEQSLNTGKSEHLESHWLNLFQAGFDSLFSPRLHDTRYLGLVPESSNHLLPDDLSALILLKRGSDLIRQLLIQQNGSEIKILPRLMPKLHCGHLVGVCLQEMAVVSLEWTKKIIRRMTVYSNKMQEVNFCFQKDVSSFRIRKDNKDKGVRVKVGEPLHLSENQSYFLDNFM